MTRRLVYIAFGAAVGRPRRAPRDPGRAALHPGRRAELAAGSIAGLGDAIREFTAELKVAMAEREAELRSTLGLDGSHDLVDYVDPGHTGGMEPDVRLSMSSAEIRRRSCPLRGHGHTSCRQRRSSPTTRRCCSVNAGMVPFKPYFLARRRRPYSAAPACRSACRTLDIEEVGKTTGTGRSSRWPATSLSATTSRRARSTWRGRC
jgi:hypothetical protein